MEIKRYVLQNEKRRKLFPDTIIREVTVILGDKI